MPCTVEIRKEGRLCEFSFFFLVLFLLGVAVCEWTEMAVILRGGAVKVENKEKNKVCSGWGPIEDRSSSPTVNRICFVKKKKRKEMRFTGNDKGS